MISYVEKELERDDELLDKLLSVSDEQKKFTPSGQHFLMKMRGSGWIAPDNLTPLYDLLEKINRHDIVHKAKLEGLVHGMFTSFSNTN
ncbi:MAG: hypothetical protein MJE68_25780 [Proteobacteria bacterium]|nr:hypothetical protein [Pseudomonadota bacterium]